MYRVINENSKQNYLKLDNTSVFTVCVDKLTLYMVYVAKQMNQVWITL